MTGILTLAVLVVSAVVFFASLMLALNGYMGQDTAVTGSFTTFIVLTVLTGLIAIAAGCWLTYFLTERKKWHAAGSTILSTFLGCLAGVGLHLGSVIIALIVAESLRTGKR